MFGLGGQEILLLACCAVVPVAAVAVAFAVGRLSARNAPDWNDDDNDEPNRNPPGRRRPG